MAVKGSLHQITVKKAVLFEKVRENSGDREIKRREKTAVGYHKVRENGRA